MRVIGLDYGSKTVGVAVSDALNLTAQGVEIIRRTSENKLRQTLARIEALIEEYEVGTIVLGFPKNMNNTIGDRAEKSLEFKEMLERRTGLPVVMWDERLSTVSAHRTMIESGVRREDRKQYVDQIAATYILQGYLDREGMKMEKIKFILNDMEDAAEFYVLEQTRINGMDYILVTDSEEDDAEALILRDVSEDGEAEAVYEIVEDDNELIALSKVFEEMMDDIDITM